MKLQAGILSILIPLAFAHEGEELIGEEQHSLLERILSSPISIIGLIVMIIALLLLYWLILAIKGKNHPRN